MRVFFASIVRIPLILLCVILPLGRSVHADETEIRITGGTTAMGSMQLLAGAFEASHPGVHITIFPGVGSSGGFQATAEGAADIGLMGRPLTRAEFTMGLTSIEYARTPLAFIAGPNAAVTDVTSEDVVKIYRGELTKWPNGESIRPILYSASDPDTILEKRISPAVSDAIDFALRRPGMIMAWSTQDGYDKVSRTPGAFGFCSLTKVLTEKGSAKILSFNGMLPSVKNLKNGSYPFFKPLYLVVRPGFSRPVREFVKFVLSSKGKRILEKTGDIPVSTRGRRLGL